MFRLTELSSDVLKRLIVVAEKREKLERELERLFAEARKHAPPSRKPTCTQSKEPQPTLTTLIADILTEAGKPLTVREIY